MPHLRVLATAVVAQASGTAVDLPDRGEAPGKPTPAPEHATLPFSPQSLALVAVMVVAVLVGFAGSRANRTR
jgi:hypothetical protein